MNVIYEGVDITNRIEINKADIIDNAGGIADSVELIFSDTEGSWSKWKPQKGHKVEIKESGTTSGVMFIDYLEQNRGVFKVKAISLPQSTKTCNTKSWENIRFLDLAGEIANKHGFELESYGIENWAYERLDQVDVTDFEFLAFRCMLEGYMAKIYNQKIIIYNEQYLEQQNPVKTVYPEDIYGDPSFKTISTGLYNACVVKGNSNIECKVSPINAPAGGILKVNLPLYNKSEGERFGKGLLRNENKKESSGKIETKLDLTLAAGSNMEIDELGFSDGKYFIEQISQRLVSGKSNYKLRRPLVGY